MMISSSRTSHRASTKARTDVSLFCISNNKKLFKVFRGANRKDVINLTTPTTKKRTKSRHCTCFLPPAKCKERISKSHAKKRRKVKSRGGYFFFREYWDEILLPPVLVSFQREEIFLHDETKKLDSSDLSLSHIIISSLIASLAFSVVVTQNAPLS